MEFRANSFDAIAEMSRNHGMEMFQKGDKAHLQAMGEMKKFMQSSDAMTKWMENKRREFEALPESE